MKHFSSLSEYLGYLNFPRPEHPLLSVVPIDSTLMHGFRDSSPPITNDFYSISLKKLVSGNLSYGRTKYDFANGAMVFMAPRQIAQWDDFIEIEDQGFFITFHEDFIRGTGLSDKIKAYGYFSYTINEALHLSPKEENIMQSIFDTIKSEYRNNQDEFSKDIIISQLETLLKFADRFYKRQFINRQESSSKLLDKFNTELRRYYEDDHLNGLPNLNTIAELLTVSQRYLSDTLKTETGKSGKEHINQFILEKAKDELLGSLKSISEIAYELGFDYPQNFSKMFKRETGMSPKSFLKQQLN
ncbi:helix-turn-helix domain-containing protein [Muricauda sp. 2012CJ35-5]|uniref:Helix-turn-helix domain-containing protein n=1 Tax=Flagellimonas spongiicola TaxID=2942208 RepID=A0ABT0PUN8_9FLAO|nr:helix-turn-helix domain-containing protein [Allomuricauda spongiicola]MCL6275105.1 helix-turn-helix domain-containing protein [Allomuricauda spongiicola]